MYPLVTKEFWKIVDDPKTVRILFWFTMVYSMMFGGNWRLYWGWMWPGL